jgi:hypothetical protein
MCWKYFVPNLDPYDNAQFEILKRDYPGHQYERVSGGSMVYKDSTIKTYGEPEDRDNGVKFYPPASLEAFDINKYQARPKMEREQVDLEDGQKVFIIPYIFSASKTNMRVVDDETEESTVLPDNATQEEINKETFRRIVQETKKIWTPLEDYGKRALAHLDEAAELGVLPYTSKKAIATIVHAFLYSYSITDDVFHWWQALKGKDFERLVIAIHGGGSESLKKTPGAWQK